MRNRKKHDEPSKSARLMALLFRHMLLLYLEVGTLFILLVLIPNIILWDGPYARIYYIGYYIGVLFAEFIVATFHVSKFNKDLTAYKNSKAKGEANK